MNKTLILIFVLGSFLNSQAQSWKDSFEIGQFVDFNLHLLDGYYDFEYKTENSLKVSFYIGDDWIQGCYYTRDSLRIDGFIKNVPRCTYFMFKPNKDTKDRKAKKIKPDICDAYIIGVDSFAVIEKFYVETELAAFYIRRREFVEIIDEIDNLTFCKHTRVGQQFSSTTYLVKRDTFKYFVSFPKAVNKFKETALRFFGEFEYLEKSIQSGKYSEKDILSMIKLLKYKKTYDDNAKICFNSSWDEIENCSELSYYAIIELVEDSIFHLKYYFNNGILIYKGGFTSFYPQRRIGDFTFYHSNGEIRKKVFYQNNEAQKVTSFYKNGKIHAKYNNYNEVPYYENINNSSGENLLDNNGNGIDVLYDSVTSRHITIEFIDHKLNNAYYLDLKGRKIYKFCESNAFLQSASLLQKHIIDEVDYPLNSASEKHHGCAFLKVVVEPTGLISYIQIIKSLDSECDRAILDYLSFMTTIKHWKPGKHNGVKVPQELIIPIVFLINDYPKYKKNDNNYWMHDPFWMNKHPHTPTYTPPLYFPK
ncbi:energy transducer TonB [Bacteroidota bacterium]